jgi:hypothetical protein
MFDFFLNMFPFFFKKKLLLRPFRIVCTSERSIILNMFPFFFKKLRSLDIYITF